MLLCLNNMRVEIISHNKNNNVLDNLVNGYFVLNSTKLIFFLVNLTLPSPNTHLHTVINIVPYITYSLGFLNGSWMRLSLGMDQGAPHQNNLQYLLKIRFPDLRVQLNQNIW